ncbi:MAG: peptide deformylase [Verrucomicrobia bacterium]|nr:peptide deformylase [Verrucomicrobiota bacterium]MBV8377904.1 peptide deformylase [Verrucomicrobiota bacterium]
MIRDIVIYGEPVLRTKGKQVEKIDNDVRTLAADMLETMYDANGVGLAAQQVGRAVQLTVIDVSDAESRPSQMWVSGKEVDPKEYMPLILINPELRLGEDLEIGTEGCLSFPEITADILRSAKVKVTAQDLQGNRIEFEAAGLLGRAVQHETDHLNGILFIDRMSSAAKASLTGRLKRLAAESKK